MPRDDVQRLFVYGTLAPGQANEHLLATIEGEWSPATVRGYWDADGWGLTQGFPGLMLDTAGAHVAGYRFSSLEPRNHLQRLDEFEGEEYQRVRAQVTMANGQAMVAYVYVVRDR